MRAAHNVIACGVQATAGTHRSVLGPGAGEGAGNRGARAEGGRVLVVPPFGRHLEQRMTVRRGFHVVGGAQISWRGLVLAGQCALESASDAAWSPVSVAVRSHFAGASACGAFKAPEYTGNDTAMATCCFR